MSSHQYETLYGVGLLDDLHNYFPAILYEPQAFPTVPSLLRYVQEQTRNRFDLFSLGQREYRAQETPSPPPVPPPTSVSSVRLPSDVSGNVAIPNSTLPSPIRRTLGGFLAGSPIATTFEYALNIPIQEEEEESRLTTQLLATLLNLPLTRRYNLPGVRGNMDQFLQPVPVRPTQAQIDENTTVGNLVSDTDHTCAICQDTLQSTQEGRKLNACGHWFHKSCIDTWLEGNVHCPVCRHDIREPLAQPSQAESP